MCNNITVKQHSNHWVIQEVCHLHNGIFHSINLCHTFSIYSMTSLVLFIMLFIREKKFSGYIAASAYHVMSRELENCVLRHSRVFIHTCIYKQPMLTKYRNYNNFEKILCSYLRYTERILGVFLLLLAVIS